MARIAVIGVGIGGLEIEIALVESRLTLSSSSNGVPSVGGMGSSPLVCIDPLFEDPDLVEGEGWGSSGAISTGKSSGWDDIHSPIRFARTCWCFIWPSFACDSMTPRIAETLIR